MHRWLSLLRNPFFRQEWTRRQRRLWAAGLATTNAVYLALFAAALLHQPTATARWGAHLAAPFNFFPWLLAGALLLSLCGHWLLPPLLLSVLCGNYELRTVALLVRERRTDEEVLRGHVAAGVAPLVVGALPLLLGCLLLARYGWDYLPEAAGGMVAAGIWGWLSTSVSFWSSCRWRRLFPATLGAYGLTCIGLPLGLVLVSAGLALGCSAGRHGRDYETTFLAAGGLTWTILVVGLAAAFWDLSLRRTFPERCQPLWQETTPPPRLEP